jgi:AcrR family transcriptional regulator
MTQRKVFDKEKVIDAAFALTREKGWGSVTARTIARALGSSTMPLYSSVSSMAEIEGEVRLRADALMRDYRGRKYADDALLSSAVGYVAFARDEKNLFRFLFVDRPIAFEMKEGWGKAVNADILGDAMAQAEREGAELSDPFVLKNWAFTHGLASLAAAGLVDLPDGRIVELVREVAAGIYLYTSLLAQGKLEEVNG